MTDAEFDRIERTYGFEFADDHRAFRAAGLTAWRRGHGDQTPPPVRLMGLGDPRRGLLPTRRANFPHVRAVSGPTGSNTDRAVVLSPTGMGCNGDLPAPRRSTWRASPS
ncbi:hypothetical protein GVV04_19400 [Micromonospora sp. NEAU-HG-1]|nr:hypothetical protein [Micromonospora rubida]